MNLQSHNSANNSIQQLEQAFATFNEVSENLGLRYKQLELKVSSLNKELATSHSERLNELKAKEQLAAKLSSLMEALPGGVVVLDQQALITEENPASIHILGKSYINQTWQQAIESASKDRATLEGEISLYNGKRISISSSIYGNLGYTIVLLTDVSENYRLNTIVNREERLAALGEMAARLAHQLRTPLSSALLYVSHLNFSTQNIEKSESTKKKLLDRLKQIERLVDGMLSYIRGDGIPAQSFSLRELLLDIKEITSIQFKANNGNLELVIPSDNCSINGDREALLNAITNLIDNSINSVNNQPLVTLSLKIVENSYVISVEDNGNGIEEKYRKKIFDPFFSTRIEGTGLGLAVVMSAVNIFSGKINVKAGRKCGTVIELLLPINRKNLESTSSLWGVETPLLQLPNTQDTRST